MDQLKKMKESLISCVEGQVYGNLDKVDTKELGEAIDMIKDLAEAIYYCTIAEAMEEGSSHKTHGTMYSMPMYKMPYPKDITNPSERDLYEYPMDFDYKMGDGSRYYREGMLRPRYEGSNIGHDGRHSSENKDPWEGKSGIHRKMYMEGKGVKDKTKQMQELEMYMQELATDMTEMIQDASPEEKQLLQQRISILATKIK